MLKPIFSLLEDYMLGMKNYIPCASYPRALCGKKTCAYWSINPHATPKGYVRQNPCCCYCARKMTCTHPCNLMRNKYTCFDLLQLQFMKEKYKNDILLKHVEDPRK